MTCEHVRLKPEVCDQTLGVICLDCKALLGCCWADEHVSEAVWNRACENDDEAVPCKQNRDDHCFLCGDSFDMHRPDSA